MPPDTEAAERFNPDTMRGQAIESEHLARYRWACQFVEGCRVLDAGCGHAYGSAMLAESGALEVVGIDRVEEVLEAARLSVHPSIRLVSADITKIPFDSASFDVIVCFEVLEHITDPDAALDEFRRVIAPGGLLVVSSPNRAVYTPGNPHHVREYLPEELREALGERFPRVDLWRQSTWMVSGLVDDARFAVAQEGDLDNAEMRKLVGGDPGDEIYTIGLASDASLPTPRPVFEINAPFELRKWDDLWRAQRLELESQAKALCEAEAEIESRSREIAVLRRELIAAEHQVSHVHELEAQVSDLNQLNDELSARLDALEPELQRLAKMNQIVYESSSWRLTAPLRRVGARLRALSGRPS